MRDNNGNTPLDLANGVEIVDYLKPRALAQACERGNLEYVRELVEKRHKCDPKGKQK